MKGLTFIQNVITHPTTLFDLLHNSILWDERMTARKTASFGVAYNYSQINYPFQKMPPAIAAISQQLEQIIGFKPNNCLVNLYPTGNATMGYHSDQTDILHHNTGIAIVSLGATRTLRFRKVEAKEEKVAIELLQGSLVYMTQELQEKWQHSIPKSTTHKPRMSLTFRSIQ